jgi:Rod binding domain-containing protein
MFLFDAYSSAAIAQNAAQGAAQNSAASVLSQNAIRSPTSADSAKARKLHQAALEFEGMLLSSLWKSMKSSFASPDDDDSQDPAHDTLSGLGIDTMSNAVAKAGGLGLGKLILKNLEPMLAHSQNENASKPGKAPGRSADIPYE